MIINGSRGAGKTYRLVELSHKTGYPIVVSHDHLIERIQHVAETAGFNIPTPITIAQAINNRTITDYLIDDVECVLERLLGGNIHAITTSDIITKI